MRFVNSPTLSYVEYRRETLGLTLNGIVDSWSASFAIRNGAPGDAVLDMSTVRVSVEDATPSPHPDCLASHSYDRPQYRTHIRVDAFPDVLPEHRKSVEALMVGRNNIRIPIIPKLTAA